MTLRKASEAFNVMKSTFHDHVKGKHNKKPGIFFLLFSKTEIKKKVSSRNLLIQIKHNSFVKCYSIHPKTYETKAFLVFSRVVL